MTEELGRYKILEEVGQGGFAIVYRAHDTELERLVALKELKPILLQDTAWVKRFRREARAIARLDHPRIVTIHDVNEIDTRLFIVMRLVEGPSLEELIADRGHISWVEAVEIIAAVAEGLDYAHAQGVLHRDLKPANILMDPERGPLLTDFGLAKLAGESSMSMTASGSVVGTPHYIAPEVWEGQGTTAQADIYALACILFEMLTGEKVFKGETPPAVMMAHFKPLVLPKVWPEGVPAGVAKVLKIALASKPADRYATASEMVSALTALAEEDQLVSQEVQPREAEAPAEVGGQDVGSASREAALAEEQPPGPQPTSPPEPAGAPETPVEQPPVRETPPLRPETPPPPPSVQPLPQAVPDRLRRRGPGCFWTSVAIVAGLILLVVVGVGGFCSSVGTYIEKAFPTVQVADTVTEPIEVPWPDDSPEANLTLDVNFGELLLAPGATELVEGSVTYNVSELKPEVVLSGRNVHLRPADDIGLAGLGNQNIKNVWDLQLGTAPLQLTVNAGGTKSEIELGGLSIAGLEVNHGGANLTLSFSEPNRIEMDALQFKGGASSATLSGLANANAQDISFAGGVGSYTLDFSGELQRDLKVDIEAGLGAVTIIVPENVPARVLAKAESNLNNISGTGAWQQTGDEYVLPGEGFQIEFEVKMGPGSLQLQNR